ncbi:MAG: hypothetical protein IKS31_05985 [Clostridia bacterium]|nr:hypothetical protein [Clostridia bacterium]MBR4458488.1 hypothetical protein [Clostridia bacterium]
MTMLLQNNPNTFAMRYIMSEDVQAGEMREQLLQSPYHTQPEPVRRSHISRKEQEAEKAWARLAARRAAERAERKSA